MKKGNLLVLLILIIWFFAGAGMVYADCFCVCANGDVPQAVPDQDYCNLACSPGGLPATCYQMGQTGGITGRPTLPNPLGGNMTPEILIGKIINALLGIVGSLALVMFVYGGFMWMLSAGNKERVQRGKDILTWATVGLVVIFSSYALVRFVFKAFEG